MTIRSDGFAARLAATGVDVCNAFCVFMFGPVRYHPHKHYMRGPGPKWREKHGILGFDEARG